jgi:hypothetical protein
MDKRIFKQRGKASDFARFARVGRSMVSMWRTGERRSIYLDRLFVMWRETVTK